MLRWRRTSAATALLPAALRQLPAARSNASTSVVRDEGLDSDDDFALLLTRSVATAPSKRRRSYVSLFSGLEFRLTLEITQCISDLNTYLEFTLSSESSSGDICNHLEQ